jgi:hypothetical protein
MVKAEPSKRAEMCVVVHLYTVVVESPPLRLTSSLPPYVCVCVCVEVVDVLLLHDDIYSLQYI